MPLRLRLSLLYSSMMMGILLLFGSAVYGLVTLLLLNHVDNILAASAQDIIEGAKINPWGNSNAIILPPMGMGADVVVQIWDRSGRLISSSPAISQLTVPLQPDSLSSIRSEYRETYFEGAHLRVLSVPLFLGGRPIGTLQAATSLGIVDAARQGLFSIVVISAAIATVLVAGFSWVAVGRALAPLETVTEVAEQINRADDLSRRIPYDGPKHDEIGSLIGAFNQTLERLESLFTSQQRFLADVSHELRTPLTVIKGNVDLMRRMKSLDEESLTSIDQEAGRLNRLVGGLLLLAQAESGSLPLEAKPVELDTLLLEVFQEMRVLAGERVKLHLTGIDQVQVQGDRDRLKQVLLNLTANAVQYTPSGGEVFLSLAKVGEQARIIIRDTGPGIPSEDLPHIFERFYRAEKSRTRSRSAGFGLGLSITQWIVDKHGGKIEVDSKEGQGTTFCIWLPLRAPSSQA